MIFEFLQRHRAGFLMICFAAFSFLCLALRVEPYIAGFKTAVWFLASPSIVYSGHFFNRLDSVRGRLFGLIRVQGENAILRDQNSQLAKWKIERDVLEQENNRLRALLGLKQYAFPNAIAAEVVMRDTRDWFQSVIINKGRKDNVTYSAAVLAGMPSKPSLIGRIVELGEQTSKVLLLTDPISSISASIPTREQIGLLEGRNKPWVLLNYLSKHAVVEVNDEVVSAGLGGVFPPGIPIGKVLSVAESQDGFFKEARVLPYMDSVELREVLVVQRSFLKPFEDTR